MTRDNRDRLSLFANEPRFEVRRLALNMDQVEEQSPPPNPAKVTDSRFEAYRDVFGESSWELDALEPAYISRLIRESIEGLIDPDRWEESDERQRAGRERLLELSEELGEEEGQ